MTKEQLLQMAREAYPDGEPNWLPTCDAGKKLHEAEAAFISAALSAAKAVSADQAITAMIETSQELGLYDEAKAVQPQAQAEDDYKRGFNDGMNEAPTGECWIRVIDEAMVGAHLGVADMGDDYGTAKKKLNDLICWSVQVDRDLSNPQASEPALPSENNI